MSGNKLKEFPSDTFPEGLNTLALAYNQIEELPDRITSYNVCYTKLLRVLRINGQGIVSNVNNRYFMSFNY